MAHELSPSDDTLRELREWLQGRDAIHGLARKWPPGCKVTSHEDAPLMVPAPGLVGEVIGYGEDGTLIVVAPSPIRGHPDSGVVKGSLVRANCEPERLIFLEEGALVTAADVARALDEDL